MYNTHTQPRHLYNVLNDFFIRLSFQSIIKYKWSCLQKNCKLVLTYTYCSPSQCSKTSFAARTATRRATWISMNWEIVSRHSGSVLMMTIFSSCRCTWMIMVSWCGRPDNTEISWWPHSEAYKVEARVSLILWRDCEI